MSFKIIPTPNFVKEIKKLSKKYPSIKSDMERLRIEIIKNPRNGVELFNNCYKVRFAIKSNGKGKSGGGRLITWIKLEGENIYLLSIYDKSQQESISISFLKSLLKDLG